MPRFLGLGDCKYLDIMGVSLIYKTLKLLVLAGVTPISSSGCYIEQKRSQYACKCGGSGFFPCDCRGVPEVLCETQHQALSVASQRSRTSSRTHSDSRSVQRNCYMEIDKNRNSYMATSCGPASQTCLAKC